MPATIEVALAGDGWEVRLGNEVFGAFETPASAVTFAGVLAARAPGLAPRIIVHLSGPARRAPRPSKASAVEASSEFMRALAEQFFSACERADSAALSALYMENARVWNNVGRTEIPRDQVLEDLAALHRRVGGWRYLNRRLVTYTGGFVEQHVVSRQRPSGAQHGFEVCAVATVEAGRIVRLDEYFDGAQLASWLGADGG